MGLFARGRELLLKHKQRNEEQDVRSGRPVKDAEVRDRMKNTLDVAPHTVGKAI